AGPGEDVDDARRPLRVAARDVRCRQREPRRGCRPLKECTPCDHCHLQFLPVAPARVCTTVKGDMLHGDDRRATKMRVPDTALNVDAKSVVSASRMGA